MPLQPVGGIQTLRVVLAGLRLSAPSGANDPALPGKTIILSLLLPHAVCQEGTAQGGLLSKLPGECPKLADGCRERASGSQPGRGKGQECAGKTRVMGEGESVTPHSDQMEDATV